MSAKASQPERIYQIKLILRDSKPPIWRRLLIPSNLTLYKLHEIIQVAMGWEDYHLHSFTIQGVYYGDPAIDQWGDLGFQNEKRFRLGDFQIEPGDKFSYEYDFGDSWEHVLLVEKTYPPQQGVRYPVCIKGKRACPPEDVGGVWGYEEYLQAIQDPKHPEHDEWLEWSGPFDPEAFDLEEVNRNLQSIR